MRAHSGLVRPRRTDGRAATINYAHADPYQTWAHTVAAGAVIASVAYMIELAWGSAWLFSRLRGFPGVTILRDLQTYVSVSVSTLMWVAVLVLTIDDPLPRAGPRLRIRAAMLRLLATASVLALTAYMLGMIPNASRIRDELLLVIDLAELVTTFLLWTHLRSTAARVGMRAVQVFAIIAMLLYLTAVLMIFWPRFYQYFVGQRLRVSQQFITLRWVTIAVSAAVAGTVMAWFAAGFRAEGATGSARV